MINNIYNKTYIDTLISNYYDKTYIYGLDTESSNLILDTYTKMETDDDYYDITHVNTQLYTKAYVITTI